MPKTDPDIEQGILAALQTGPMKQADLGDLFPLERYIAVGNTVRDMAARGLIEREKCTPTYWVRLAKQEIGTDQDDENGDGCSQSASRP